MYGSSLMLVTRMMRDSRIAARDAAAMPFPREETTPPVTKTYLVIYLGRVGMKKFTGIPIIPRDGRQRGQEEPRRGRPGARLDGIRVLHARHAAHSRQCRRGIRPVLHGAYRRELRDAEAPVLAVPGARRGAARAGAWHGVRFHRPRARLRRARRDGAAGRHRRAGAVHRFLYAL